MRPSLLIAATTLLACGKIGIDSRDEHGMTALMRASRAGDVAEVRRLIDRGADVNAVVPTRPFREFVALLSWMQQLPKSDYGYTALHYAADSGRAEVARVLIEKGADPRGGRQAAGLSPMDIAILRMDLPTLDVLTSRTRPGPHQMWLATSSGRAEVVRLLLDRGGDVKGEPEPFAGNRRREPLAILAVERQSPEVLKLLLDAGVDANARDQNGWTALRHLRERGPNYPRASEMTALLEGRGASDPGGMRDATLFEALHAKNAAGVRAALAAGANPNALGDRGVPPLVWAARRGLDTIVAILVDGGAHVNASPEFDTTPLISAIESGSIPSVQKLLAAGARADMPDHIKRTPLRVAADWKRTEIAKMLLDASAPIDPRALPNAALNGNAELVKLLIDRGADVNADSGAALSEAARGCTRSDNTEVIRALLQAGAKPNLYRDMSPLERAVRLCPPDAARLLREAGAR